jgi:hypothetical protein
VADVRDALPEKRFPVETLPEDLDAVSTKAEAGFYSEAVVIKEQARQAQPLQKEENLLPVAADTVDSEKLKCHNPSKSNMFTQREKTMRMQINSDRNIEIDEPQARGRSGVKPSKTSDKINAAIHRPD